MNLEAYQGLRVRLLRNQIIFVQEKEKRAENNKAIEE